MSLVINLTFRILFVVILYGLCRLVFLLNNWSLFEGLEASSLAFSFLNGLRFDIAAILVVNSIYLLIALLPFLWSRSIIKWLLSLYFIIANTICIAFSIFDAEYFQFTGRRLMASSFSITQDIESQLGFIAIDYWYFSVLIVAMGLGLFYFDLKLPLKPYSEMTASMRPHLISLKSIRKLEMGSLKYAFKDIMAVLAFLFLVVLGSRGGWQVKPIIPAMAFASQQAELANLSLNSAFTIIKSYKHSPISRQSFFTDWHDVELNLSQLPVQKAKVQALLPRGTNIIILILESFNLEYMGLKEGEVSYTPYLNQLAQRGVFFPNHYANGRRSIDAMPSIFAGIPSWMPHPFITSPYQGNDIQTLPKIFKERGYSTLFFHGGEDGTMFFDVMAERFGFQRYIGANSYPKASDHDGRWGIFDEPFLKFTADQITESAKPFFASIFTLSSHHPYTIPEKYKNKFPKGSLDIHESIGYADYAVHQFFEYAKNTSWYEDTLFILTADHTSKSFYKAYQSDEGQFRVPLIFYHPNQKLSYLSANDLAQHIDIMPTIFDMMGWSRWGQLPRFGQSLLIHNNRHVILNIADNFKLIRSAHNNSVNQLKIDTNLKKTDINSGGPWQDILKAKVQYYYNGMIEDRLIW